VVRVVKDELSERDLRVLAFEAQWPRHTGTKDHAIMRAFGIAPARYYQVLNAVIDSPAAVRHDPMLVRRLQRARTARAEARNSRAFASPLGDTVRRLRPNETAE
jgi:Protein of unknown function (DUF3263)